VTPRDGGPDEIGSLTALRPGSATLGGALTAHGRDEHVYPEWDAVARAYRADWCLVRTSRPAPVRSLARYRRALARHGALLPGLQRAVDRVRAEGRDLELRRRDGADLDLDACVEAISDLRAGLPPTDRVHASMVEGRRDVAVAIALDLSASTAQALPPDPDRPGVVERILDLERDAVILLTEVLERMGDAYGVSAFSGAGRDDVRLYTVKELDQPRSAAALHRLGGLVPDHTTRMAPAIRHLSAELVRHPARTKILLMISDGRPYDIDYGQEYGEQAILPYALADTAHSFAEARAAGVSPYLVTVDPSGADYLGRVCDPREYHVIENARALPAALAQLYVVVRSRG
jgi:nitric oxide reductase activation protein